MFFLGPIRNNDNEVIAAFSIRIDPSAEFSEILQSSTNNITGDTYAISSEGMMLSDSKFGSDLYQLGLLNEDQHSALVLRIANPGYNLYDKKLDRSEIETFPLTNLAREVTGFAEKKLTSHKITITDAYGDYRGIPVFGSGAWYEEYNFGIISEIDEDEVLLSYSSLRTTVYSILIFTFFLTTSGILLVLMLGERANKVLVQARDELEEKVVERTAELNVAKEEAESATKAKGDFLANMSHEIRTPMNAIIGLNHLLSRTEMSNKQKDYVNKVSNSAQGLLGIINDILDFSKIEAGKMDIENIDFELNDVVDNLLNLISEKVRAKGLELIIAIDKDVPSSINGDPLRIGQILLNFVSNALKFTETGEIKIACNLISQEDDSVELKFSVHDTGVGLSEEQQNKLFQAFTQADTSTTRKYGGTGLGLSISKRLAELMGGVVGVQGELGVGSVFYFTITCKVLQNPVRNNMVIPREFHDLRVLIVDDNESAREILYEYMRDFNFRVKTVENGREAINELVKANVEEDDPFQLILQDYRMPDMNGIDVLKEIKKLKVHIQPKVILVTGYGREDILKEAEDASFDGFLLKPVRQSVLFETIMEVFGHEAEISNRKESIHGEFSESLNPIRGASILLVEDNEINQQVAMELLESEGFFVDIAENGKNACDKIAVKEYELVLMDLQMPVMNGFEATNRIRNTLERKDLPVIAMTADAMNGVEEIVKAAGMNDYITKPIDLVQLWKALGQWVKPGERKLPQGYIPKVKSESDNLFPAIEGIDTVSGLKRVGKNQKLYKNLLKKFINEYSEATAHIAELQDEGKVEEAIREAHTVKGVSANLGAKELHEQMVVIEEKLKGNEDLQMPLKKANRIIKQLILGIIDSGVVSEKTADQKKGDPISDEDLVLKLTEAAEHLRKRKPKPAIDILESLSHFTISEEIQTQLDEAQKFLSNYKMKEALSVLEKMLNQIMD